MMKIVILGIVFCLSIAFDEMTYAAGKSPSTSRSEILLVDKNKGLSRRGPLSKSSPNLRVLARSCVSPRQPRISPRLFVDDTKSSRDGARSSNSSTNSPISSDDSWDFDDDDLGELPPERYADKVLRRIQEEEGEGGRVVLWLYALKIYQEKRADGDLKGLADDCRRIVKIISADPRFTPGMIILLREKFEGCQKKLEKKKEKKKDTK
jgi:hypothetical protein